MTPLKYLHDIWRPLVISQINFEINWTWSTGCVIVSTNNADLGASFGITETTLYVPVVILSTQDNAKLLQQLRSGFKRTSDWNKYTSKPELLRKNGNLNFSWTK